MPTFRAVALFKELAEDETNWGFLLPFDPPVALVKLPCNLLPKPSFKF